MGLILQILGWESSQRIDDLLTLIGICSRLGGVDNLLWEGLNRFEDHWLGWISLCRVEDFHVLQIDRQRWSDLPSPRPVRVPAALALTVHTGLRVHVAGTPLATAGQLARTGSGVTTPTPGPLALRLPAPNTRPVRTDLHLQMWLSAIKSYCGGIPCHSQTPAHQLYRNLFDLHLAWQA